MCKDAPSAASMPETGLQALAHPSLPLPTPASDVTGRDHRPPGSKGMCFLPASWPPLSGSHQTPWVWVWAPTKGQPFSQEPPHPDIKIGPGFCSPLPWGGKPAGWTWQNQNPFASLLRRAVPCLPLPPFAKTACYACGMETVSWQNTESKYLKGKKHIQGNKMPCVYVSVLCRQVLPSLWWLETRGCNLTTVVKNMSPSGLPFLSLHLLFIC